MRERIENACMRGIGVLDPSHKWRSLLTRGRDPFRVAEKDHFDGQLTPAEAARLFSASVSMVEIETSSYCNRVCWFCPNATHDRRTEKFLMEATIYQRVLRDLASIRYRQKISFSRYNEPLASRSILERVAEARSALPDALLHLNTNGDYLTRDYLAELYAAGLRSMNIQVYLGNEDDYEHQRVRTQLLDQIKTLGVEHQITKDRPGRRLEAKLSYRDMALRIYGRNFAEDGCDRAGTVALAKTYTRTSPCVSPFYHAYIDYDGSMVPCCNIRSDIPELADCAIGKLSETISIFDVYGSEAAAKWRRSLVGNAAKEGVCASCSFVTFPQTALRRRTQDRLVRLRDASQR